MVSTMTNGDGNRKGGVPELLLSTVLETACAHPTFVGDTDSRKHATVGPWPWNCVYHCVDAVVEKSKLIHSEKRESK